MAPSNANPSHDPMAIISLVTGLLEPEGEVERTFCVLGVVFAGFTHAIWPPPRTSLLEGQPNEVSEGGLKPWKRRKIGV